MHYIWLIEGTAIYFKAQIMTNRIGKARAGPYLQEADCAGRQSCSHKKDGEWEKQTLRAGDPEGGRILYDKGVSENPFGCGKNPEKGQHRPKAYHLGRRAYQHQDQQ